VSYAAESIEANSVHWGLAEPFGMYAPALVDPPEGSDLLEEWEFFYGLAQRMGLSLFVTGLSSTTATAREGRQFKMLDMENKPSTDELFELLTAGSRIPLSEVKRHPDGALFGERILAEPREPDCEERLDVGNGDMIAELAAVLGEPTAAQKGGAAYPYRMVSRRLANVYNSSGRDLASLMPKRGGHNPAFMHPEDLAALGLTDGDRVALESRHGSIEGFVEPDETLRRGLVSMTHAFGDAPGAKAELRKQGANTSILTSVEEDWDPISGIPRMSAVPVRVTPLSR
jgi:anaerobic selenocysteine-containing dehydrogenase